MKRVCRVRDRYYLPHAYILYVALCVTIFFPFSVFQYDFFRVFFLNFFCVANMKNICRFSAVNVNDMPVSNKKEEKKTEENY